MDPTEHKRVRVTFLPEGRGLLVLKLSRTRPTARWTARYEYLKLQYLPQRIPKLPVALRLSLGLVYRLPLDALFLVFARQRRRYYWPAAPPPA